MGTGILMTEDDEVSGALVTEDLIARGYTVVWCLNGQDCRQTLQRNPDTRIVILDLGLPDVPGEELLQEIPLWSEPGRRRVIVVTATLVRGEEKAFLDRLPRPAQQFVSSVLVKPFDMDRLHQAIGRALYEVERGSEPPVSGTPSQPD